MSKDLKKEIIGWMNKDLNRGRTVPIFENLVDELELAIQRQERAKAEEPIIDILVTKDVDNMTGGELASLIYGAITSLDK